MKGIIRLGDGTSHGGKVTSASGRMKVDGKEVALLGDACSCPIPGHGSPTIVEGDPDFTLDGKPVAHEGHKISCGATLIPTTQMAGFNPGGGSGSSASSYSASTSSSSALPGTTLARLAIQTGIVAVPSQGNGSARTGNLSQATLEKAHFAPDQAAAVSKAGNTAMDLAGAIAVIEAAKNPETINGTAGAMSNAFDRSDVLKSGITQADLTRDDNKLLSMITTHGAYDVLTRPDMMKQITELLTSHNSLVGNWKLDYTAIRSGGANPVGDHRAFWVNVGSAHNGKNHIPTYKDTKGAVNNVTAGMRGGCLVIGGLCFRDSYRATKVEIP